MITKSIVTKTKRKINFDIQHLRIHDSNLYKDISRDKSGTSVPEI